MQKICKILIRFFVQIIHGEATDDWTLQIQYSQPRDSGVYKCQVNSDPKIARNVYLSITGSFSFNSYQSTVFVVLTVSYRRFSTK